MYHSIIHLSDIHIRVGDTERSRYHEYSSVFHNLVHSISSQESIRQRTALIVVTGDIFHHKNKLEPCGLELALQLLVDLSKLAPVIMIRGNHDYRQDLPKEPDMITALMKYQLPGVHYLDTTGIFPFENVNFGITAIQDTLLYGSTSGISNELPPFPIPPPKSSQTYNIALFHGSVTSSTLQNGMSISPTIHSYPIEWFGSAYDAILLGDIHLQQVKRVELTDSKQPELPYTTHSHTYSYTSDVSPWGYPGSLIQQDFGETLSGHGYIVWNLRDKVIHTYHVTNPYGFVKLRFDETCDTLEILYREVSNMTPTYVPLSQLIDQSWFPSNLHVSYNGKVFNHALSQRIEEYFRNYNKRVIRINQPAECDAKSSSAVVSESTSDDAHQLHRINSHDVLIEYIQKTLTKKTLSLPDIWMSWIKHPELLTLSTDSLPDVVTKKISERSEKLVKYSSAYLEDFGRASSTSFHTGSLHLHTMEWNWVLNYKDGNVFDFDKNQNQLSILNAKNGHGKSNFLEVICISIFGEGIPSRFNKNYTSTIICDKKPAGTMANTSIIFTLNSKKYMLKRVLKNNSDKRSIAFHEVSVSEFDSDTLSTHIIHQGQNAVSQWIDVNIGSINAYLMTAMLSQNADVDFFSLDKSRQRALLDQVMSLEHINSLQILLKESIKYYKHVTDVVESYSGGITRRQIESFTDRGAELEGMNIAHRTSVEKSSGLYPQWNHMSEARLLSVKDIEQLRSEHARLSDVIQSLPKGDLSKEIGTLTSIQDDIAVQKRYLSDLQSYSDLDTCPLPEDLTIPLQEYVSKYSHDDLIDRLLPFKTDLLATLSSHPYHQSPDVLDLYSPINNIIQYRNRYESSERTESGYMIRDLLKRTREFEVWSSIKESEFSSIRSYLDNDDRFSTLESELTSVTLIAQTYPSMIEKEEDELSQLVTNLSKLKQTLEKLQESRPNKPSISPARLQELNSSVGHFVLDDLTSTLERVSSSIDNIPPLCSQYIVCDTKIRDIRAYIEEHHDMPFNARCKACKQQPWRKKYDSLVDQLPDLEKTQSTIMDSLSTLLCDDVEIDLYPTDYARYIEHLRHLQDTLRQQIADLRLFQAESSITDTYRMWVIKHDKMKRDYDMLEQQLVKHRTTIHHNRNTLHKAMLSLQDLRSTHDRILSKKREYTEYRNEYDIQKSVYDKDKNALLFSWYDTILNYRCVVFVLHDEIVGVICALQEMVEEIQTTICDIKKRNELSQQLSSVSELIRIYPVWQEWKKEKDIEKRLLLTIHEIQAQLQHVATLKEPSDEEGRIQLTLDQTKKRLKIVSSLVDIFDGYREWLYTTQIGPLVQERVNRVLRMICEDRVITLDSEWLPVIDTLSWFILDGSSRVIIEKASGFQRFIVGVAIRVAFHQIGLCRTRFDQHFIDEGFTACDSDNLERVPAFLNSLLGFYQGIYLVTHLEELKACSPNHIYIQRDVNGLSQIQHGNAEKIASIPQDAPKKRGRPPKATVVITKV